MCTIAGLCLIIDNSIIIKLRKGTKREGRVYAKISLSPLFGIIRDVEHGSRNTLCIEVNTELPPAE